MSRSIFGWSLPPGVTSKMIDEAYGVDQPCAVCARDIDSCVCPECPTCHETGSVHCYAVHGLRLSKQQVIHRQEARVHRAEEDLRIEKQCLEQYKESERTEWDIDDVAEPWM